MDCGSHWATTATRRWLGTERWGTSRIEFGLFRHTALEKLKKTKEAVKLLYKCKRQSNPCAGLVRPWRPPISRQPGHESAKAVTPRQGPSLRRWGHPRAVLQPEGLCQWKITMTVSGTKLATFRFVLQPTPDDGQTNYPKHVEFHAKINLWNWCI